MKPTNREIYSAAPEEQNESASARPADEFTVPLWLTLTDEREKALRAHGFRRNRFAFVGRNGQWVDEGKGWLLHDGKGRRYFTDCMALAELKRLEDLEGGR